MMGDYSALYIKIVTGNLAASFNRKSVSKEDKRSTTWD